MQDARMNAGDWSTEGDWSERSTGWSDRCREISQATVEDYPLSTTIGMFAIGLSLGVAVGAAMARPMGRSHSHMAESLGRRLLDTLHDYVPDSVNQYLRS